MMKTGRERAGEGEARNGEVAEREGRDSQGLERDGKGMSEGEQDEAGALDSRVLPPIRP